MNCHIAIVILSSVCGVLMAAGNPEPKISSIYPMTLQTGQSTSVVIRGENLGKVQSIFFREPGITSKIDRIEEVQAVKRSPAGKISYILHATFVLEKNTQSGEKKYSVVTPTGISNELAFHVTEGGVIQESDNKNLPVHPILLNGKIEASGEMDDYWVTVSAGELLTFQAKGNTALDPSITLYEKSGSWFDPNRLNRLAFNDEPLIFPGMSRNAVLIHRFQRAGTYCVRIQGQTGQGGSDSFYELQIRKEKPSIQPLRPVMSASADWEEWELTRAIGSDWMTQLANRSSVVSPPPQMETYRAVEKGSSDIPVMKIPGVVEGVIGKAGEQHVLKINVDKAQDMVIEVETPAATTPVFNPIVRLMEPGGTEIIGNVYTRLNNNNLGMMKSLKAKATFSLVAPGLYTLDIRELNTDHAGENFKYRVLIRPQIPHVGKLKVQQERVNLPSGGTRPLSIRLEREEGYQGTVVLQVEDLPTGVTAFTGVEDPNERPVLPNAGKLERYQPRVQATSLVLSAAENTLGFSDPKIIRVVARPIRDGQLGQVIASKEVLLMVVNP